ncbi:hypothetical protein COW36_09360 [bacterium (Candidatus Blackallbacteria) CG17_big_fil_post_rev_8_21_14_2_50_48_46]|uniref:Uncharacterized protein n=1 Tax=bacterium (Candidatus Blackallbacteria) CG17_big_fil_post_rev_8_21_14_2_50_48_46 TaxID=2014261 RepID=A0A2M7G627_9BACT|nr:MAG: hypothetical protein COW64_23690 [bacterium (Candidatus Blackallbacteria) CG18_big_fil_WC_8_21_14_2_50_49_26]PIW17372.1 MAG: hypothetical protein COW36_09360 [bacterium (Candidatus Blackallbacteria) CG17_big_fil_post_rev_8_21_14_2_50_48_46]PIW47396.1 MAG: hypothetical protein COW20_12470 [bacterium (Candidatus Blackallbacteria) CG13_big_fil_rev_8_21_14_2_50_49_14]
MLRFLAKLPPSRLVREVIITFMYYAHNGTCRLHRVLYNRNHTYYWKKAVNLNLPLPPKHKTSCEFITYWSSKYIYSDEWKYDQNISLTKPFTKESREQLFQWKNGTGDRIAQHKMNGILLNYPLHFCGDIKRRYLNASQSGGAIWNIFYAHCLEPENWPIFDQHVYRAMQFLKKGSILELSQKNKDKYEVYLNEYINFFKSFSGHPQREIDKALMCFGKYLKAIKPYI